SHGIEHDTVADHTAATGTQHAARNQLQDEFLALDDDRVAGIVATGIAGHDGKIVGEYVDNLALAFVAPLRADDDRGSHFAQKFTPFTDSRGRFLAVRAAFPGGRTHWLPAIKTAQLLNGWDVGA